jgi:hypothetical protein
MAIHQQKARIEFNDSVFDIIHKMSEGNPGAITVLMMSMNHCAKIDKASAFGPISDILSLDTHGIYGSRIWMLFKDVCGERLPVMTAMLRACQLGYLKDTILDQMIDGELDRETIKKNVEEYPAKVKKHLGDKFDIDYKVV